MKEHLHVIASVEPGSIADELELEAGDILLEINGNKIEDVFDYRCMILEEYLEVLIRKADGEEWLLEVDKDEDEDLGLEFETGLMSEYRSCTSHFYSVKRCAVRCRKYRNLLDTSSNSST